MAGALDVNLSSSGCIMSSAFMMKWLLHMFDCYRDSSHLTSRVQASKEKTFVGWQKFNLPTRLSHAVERVWVKLHKIAAES